MFVHDFVELDLPMGAVLDALVAGSDLRLDAVVRQAWCQSVAGWEGDPLPEGHQRVGDLRLTFGALRFRGRTVIVGLAWSDGGSAYFPALDADLEIVPVGDRRTNLHLLGRYRFTASAPRPDGPGSVANLLTILTVRRFLGLLAARLDDAHRRRTGAAPSRLAVDAGP